MKKMLCILPQVTGGGAERFFLTFLQQVDCSKYEPIVALVCKGGGFDSEIPSHIKIYEMTAEGISTQILAPLGPASLCLSFSKDNTSNQA